MSTPYLDTLAATSTSPKHEGTTKSPLNLDAAHLTRQPTLPPLAQLCLLLARPRSSHSSTTESSSCALEPTSPATNDSSSAEFPASNSSKVQADNGVAGPHSSSSIQLRARAITLLLSRWRRALTLFLAKWSGYASSFSGLDKSLMLVQYGLKILVGLGASRSVGLLLAQFTKYSTPLLSALGSALGSRLGMGMGMMERMGALSGTLGDMRTGMRLLGLVPCLASLLDPATTHSLSSISYLQLLLLTAYYPLEHAVYLASHGVLPLSAKTQDKWSVWSCRFWAGYVILEFYNLAGRFQVLKHSAHSLTLPQAHTDEKRGDLNEEAEGAPGADVAAAKKRKALDGDIEGWTEELVVNTAYLPLTVHWSLPAGLWENPAWTGVFGTLAAITGIRAGWRRC